MTSNRRKRLSTDPEVADSNMYVPRRPKRDKTQQQQIARVKEKTYRQDVFDLESYVDKQDFVGALTLLRVNKRKQEEQSLSRTAKDVAYGTDHQTVRLSTWWTAYCHFHNGDFSQALEHFEGLIEAASSGGDATAADLKCWRLSRACCLFYLQDCEDAEHAAMGSSRSLLCNRLLFLLAHRRRHGEQVLLDRYEQLSRDSVEDQLALASTSFAQRNFQEATEIYKRLIAEASKKNAEGASALHVYLALCYFKLDYYDVSLELLAVYLTGHPDSFFAVNLKASCTYRLYSAQEAQSVLDNFARRFPNHPCSQAAIASVQASVTSSANAESAMSNVMQHNLAIFRVSSGEGGAAGSHAVATAERLLGPLTGHLEEAQLNLVLLYLKRREYHKAFALVEDLNPHTTAELTMKAVLHGVIGEQTHSKEHIFLAEKYFHAVGSSNENCDTIPGRQCMASYYLLRREFNEANVYLSSISTYLGADDAFNWNYGTSLAAAGSYREAEEVLLRVQNPKLRSHLVLCGWLARCYIYSGRASLAWEIYLKTENSESAFVLVKQIANDCYKAKEFFYAAKAFDVLERLVPDPENWEGKRGACIGFFHRVASGQEREHGVALSHRCEEVLKMLGSSKNVLEASKIVSVLRRWVASVL